MKLNKKLFFVAGLGLLAFSNAGCGKGPNGTYTVNQCLSQASTYGSYNTSTTNGCSTISLTISDNKGAVTGTGSNASYSDNLTGTSSGDQITNVSLTITPIATTTTSTTQTYPYGGYNPYAYSGQQVQTSCVYTGTLNFGNNQLNGTLTLQNTTATTQTTYGYSSCAQSVTLTGTMTN